MLTDARVSTDTPTHRSRHRARGAALPSAPCALPCRKAWTVNPVSLNYVTLSRNLIYKFVIWDTKLLFFFVSKNTIFKLMYLNWKYFSNVLPILSINFSP